MVNNYRAADVREWTGTFLQSKAPVGLGTAVETMYGLCFCRSSLKSRRRNPSVPVTSGEKEIRESEIAAAAAARLF